MKDAAASPLTRFRAGLLLVAGFNALTASGCSKRAAAGAQTEAGSGPTHSDSGGSPTGASPSTNTSASGRSTAGSGNEIDDPRFPSHVAALAWEVKVHEQPAADSPWVGYLRAGAVVRSAAKPVSKQGCAGGWYAIAPSGFVCVDPNVATTDASAPVPTALTQRPDLSGRLPYMYGLVRTLSAIYSRLPTLAEAAHAEYMLRPHVEHWLRARGGAEFRPDYWMRWKNIPAPDATSLWAAQTTEEVPSWLEHGGMLTANLSGLLIGRRLVVGHTQEHQGFAFIDTAVSEGRRYAITTDALLVPVDRLRPIEGSSYHGVHIPDDIDVPFALVRREGAWEYELRDGNMVRKQPVARRAAVKLTGKDQVVGTRHYYETAAGTWLDESHASRIERFRRVAKWAQDGERWIDVSIAQQALIAYEGTKPVYATLVSTGEAGLDDPETTKSTVLGDFRIFAKHITTTMSSEVVGEEFELKDIPFVEYFEEGYALHAAYWHDDFGVPRSHGCINLAPEDAKWLFAWTEPHIPQGWHGARSADRGSVVSVHR